MARDGNDLELDYGEDDGGRRSGPQPRDWLLLTLRAARRRKLLFLSVFVIACGGVFGYYELKTPVYRVEAKILAQRQQILSTLRSGPEDHPTRTAWELIHRRENLVSLVKSANLLAPAEPGILRTIRGTLERHREDDIPLDRTVKKLDQALTVTADEGTIDISFDWPNAEQAYRVVDGALQNFIEARHIQEVTAIEEVMAVLRARASKAKEQLDRVTDDVRREMAEGFREAASSGAREAASMPRLAASTPKGPSEELVRLKSVLEGKQRAIEDVEEFRRRRLADLHARLDEMRNTFSDAHPSVIQLRQDIDALTKDSSQVASLHEEEVALRKEYQAKLAQEGMADVSTTSGTPTALPVPRNTVRQRASNTPVEDDERVRDARFEYQQILEHVNGAQLELDAVRAAFKYRYNVIWPPQLPRDPVSPNPIKIFGAGLVAAFLLSIAMAAAPDLRSGRIIERWQVERSLGLPVLAELHKK